MKNNRIAGISLIGLVLTCSMLLVMLGLFAFSFSGVEPDSPTVVFYGHEGSFPQTSIRNSLASAGYDFDIASDSDINSETGLYELPKRVNDKNGVVVVALGNSAITCLKSFSSVDAVSAIVLVDPMYEGNIDMEGFGSNYPAKPVAIFDGKSKPSSVYEMSAGAIIYERLSGADTIYGSYSRQDKLFSSRHYTNPEMNRFLSISAFDYSDPSLVLFSPIFQSELANFLGATGSRTAVWYVLLIMAAAFSIAGMLMTVSVLPMSRMAVGGKDDKKYDKRAMVTIGGMILAFMILAIVLSIIGAGYEIISYLVPFFPVVMLVIMTISVLPIILNKKVRPRRTQVNKPYIFIGVAVEVLYFVLLLVNVTDFTIRENILEKAIAIALAGILDFGAIYLLVYAERKSIAANQGRCSYFGRMEMMLLTLLPAAFVFLFGTVFSVDAYVRIGLMGLSAAVLPYLMTFSIKNHSGSCIASSLVHSCVYVLLLISIL